MACAAAIVKLHTEERPQIKRVACFVVQGFHTRDELRVEADKGRWWCRRREWRRR